MEQQTNNIDLKDLFKKIITLCSELKKEDYEVSYERVIKNNKNSIVINYKKGEEEGYINVDID